MYVTGITLNYTGSAAATKKDLNQSVREALLSVGSFWYTEFLPRHFEPDAVRKYGYSKRSKGYQRRKAAVRHNQKPMSWTGEMERQAKSHAEIRSTATKGKVVLRGIRALNFAGRSKSSLYPDFKKELTATTGDELQEFARRMDDCVTGYLNRLNKSKKVKP